MSHPLWRSSYPLLLGSGSATRRDMLIAAGIPVEILRPQLDEKTIAQAAIMRGETGAEIAVTLANQKAISLLSQAQNRLLLTADQTLECSGQTYFKAETIAEARAQLLQWRGKTHALHSAACLYHNGEQLWAGAESAYLTLRNFSPTFLDAYLDQIGAAALSSVGSYQIEGLGLTLFERIEGTHFTILGLPMLPLLQVLRDNKRLLA